MPPALTLLALYGWLLLPLPGARAQTEAAVPDEQRLYTALMDTYEASVRPVMNASRVISINFRLTLNQIVDLEERTQVLTTNVFIDQDWTDENLRWDPDEYNGIKTLRVPAHFVWLPDTFIFNNADDGSTGFMQGVYVLLNANGTVLWPVPVKLKSSCKVDITYFPFDDQQCILRFGSWIYSGEWINFESSISSIDLRYYIDNSEWELVAIAFEKNERRYGSSPDLHPDLTYTLHMRRRTFYYIFNIIVPCIMLSVLTLLTFWLPTTSGEKISLGLSVFLAFSMFMLLIAEEVPATSESVPLIGIYLTTVMTMTSVSVIMAVMVINLYNRGSKANRAPNLLKKIVLVWICKLLRMSNDLEILAKTIKLIRNKDLFDETEEQRYYCQVHNPKPKSRRGSRSCLATPRTSLTPETAPAPHLLATSPLLAAAASKLRAHAAAGGSGGHSNFLQLPKVDSYGNAVVSPSVSYAAGGGSSSCKGQLQQRNGQCQNGQGHVTAAGASFSNALDVGDCTALVGDDCDVRFMLPPASGEATATSSVDDLELQGTTAVVEQNGRDLDGLFSYNDVWYDRSHKNNNSIEKYPTQTVRNRENNNRCVVNAAVQGMPVTAIGPPPSHASRQEDDEDPVWLRRESVLQREQEALVAQSREEAAAENNVIEVKKKKDTPAPPPKQKRFSFKTKSKEKHPNKDKITTKFHEDLRKCALADPGLEFFLNCGRHDILAGLVSDACRKEKALAERRAMIVEWQTIATVIDRLLFWIFLIGTLAAYFVILFAMPWTKPSPPDDVTPFHVLKNAVNNR